ncbi:MAG: threonine aldolase family protein [Candidatus Hermodarchaeota archaeon]
MKIVDLRSDTFTKPSPEMWEMLKSLDNSHIGDDVFSEDPSVNALEEKAAKIIGKEAAVYVTSGTQGNLTSLLAHTNPGEQILIEEQSHIYQNELSSATKIAGLKVNLYSSNRGTPSVDELQKLIEDYKERQSPIKLLCSENTHNYHGGALIRSEVLKDMKQFAEKNGLKFHLDGARIFNAAVGLGVNVTEITKYVDSVMFCLSKGLSCPVGSLVAGSKRFISEVRKYRKMVGGCMRQAGVIASFGLIALEPKWIQRLDEDHKNAKLLANGIEKFNLPIKILNPDTNIIIVSIPEEIRIGKVVRKLGDEGILAFNIDKRRIRFVTHFGINEEDIQYAIEKISMVFSKVF